MDNVPILQCPLAKESGFSIHIVPAYFLTNGHPELIKERSLGFKVPEAISTEIRRIHRLGEEQGWTPLIAMTCLIKGCSRCIPGVAWGIGDPCFYVVPTDIAPGQIIKDNVSFVYPPEFLEP